MNYFSKAAAAVLLTGSVFMAGCGQVHVGTLDRERVQEEAPQLKAVVTEANAKLMEAQQEDVVKSKKLDVVMDSSKAYPSVLSGGEDITDEVIQKLQ